MYKSQNRKKHMRTLAVGAALANGYWTSLTQTHLGNGGAHGGGWSPVLLAMASVMACYFSVAWLVQGMRAK
ncbi:MAG: hypothetical protein JWP91_3240 [Fibrobacteres bacterium]|nr:hypothetical protein [Fibrobacterota bacterium]